MRRVVLVLGAASALILSMVAPAGAAVSPNDQYLSLANRTYPVTRTYTPAPPITAGTGKGYWLAAADGGVFAFGDAQFAGSAAGLTSHAIVGIAKTITGKGYWLVASDGGVFSFGDAKFYGSLPGLNPAPKGAYTVAGIATAADGNGYYIYTRAGNVYAFGSAQYYGTPAGWTQDREVTGLAVTPSGKGYWMIDVRGSLWHYGDAPDLFVDYANQPYAKTGRVQIQTWSNLSVHVMALDGSVYTAANDQYTGFFYGATTNADYPMTGFANSTGSGYYEIAADGSVFTHGDAKFYGSVPQYVGAKDLVAPIIGVAVSGSGLH